MGYFSGLGKTVFVMAQGILGAFGVRIPVSFAMSRLLNVRLFTMSLTFIRRTLVARSFSSSFMEIYLMFFSISGIMTYSSALTRRRVFSISEASSCVFFSACASASIS